MGFTNKMPRLDDDAFSRGRFWKELPDKQMLETSYVYGEQMVDQSEERTNEYEWVSMRKCYPW